MEASSAPLSADAPGVLGLDEVLRQVAEDDQEEWDYEYSATETETYYLTLELSYPEFKDRATRGPHHSRGGYYKNMMDQSTAFPRAAAVAGAKDDDDDGTQSDDNDDDDNGESEGQGAGDDGADDDDGPPLDPELLAASKSMEMERRAAKKGKENDEDEEEEEGTEALEDIQILDLHSANPIISYRGRVFEGQWAEVIGTEAILARHDKGKPLPALRSLADKVDVLAASSSRIMTTEKVLKPRVAEEDTLAPIKDEWNIRIPRGKDRTGERARQASFLENLIALKKKKGQTDQVTVYATDGAGKDWDDRHGPDYKRRVKRRTGPASTGGAGAEAEAEAQGEGQGRRRRRGRRSARAAGGRARGGGGTGATQARRGELSIPTPGRWEELWRQGGDEEMDESEGDARMSGLD